jgi:hypothetical protein
MEAVMKKNLAKFFLFSAMFLLAVGSVCVSCVSAPDAGNAKHDMSVNTGKNLNGNIFTTVVFSKIRSVLVVNEKDRAKKIELSAGEWNYNSDTTEITLTAPVPFDSYIVSIGGVAEFPYTYVLNGIADADNLLVALDDRLAIKGYDYLFDSGTNRLTFRSDIDLHDHKWYISYDADGGGASMGDWDLAGNDRLSYLEAQHRKQYLDSWYDSQNSFWFFPDSLPQGQKPELVKRAATPQELQNMKSTPVPVMKFRMKTTERKLSRELGYKTAFPKKVTLPEYAAEYTTQFQTIEEYSDRGKLVRKLYVFYELTSDPSGRLPPNMGLYILPPDIPADTDAPETNMIISSDAVDMGVTVSRVRSWAMVSSNMAGIASKPDVNSVTDWSWHTAGAGYLLEAESSYDAVSESFIRQFVHAN